MDAGIPHTLMEYFILLLFGGGGARWAYTWRQNRNSNNDKLSVAIKDAHEPILKELKDLCKISEKTYNELHTYIAIQKDRDRRGGVR